MANESLIATTDNQVDLNNNDAKLSRAGAKSDENGDRQPSNGSTGVESRSPTDESDDLVLRLKKIILQQEQEEKAKQRLIAEKQNHPEPFSGEQSDDKRQNGSNQSSSLGKTIVEKASELNKSQSSVRTQLNGSKSPKTDKRSISQIKKSPVPSRKMINQTNSEINGKPVNGRPASAPISPDNDVNQELVKETVKKISDLATNKVSQNGHPSLNGNSDESLINGHANGTSNVKISINGRSVSSSTSECSSSSEHSMSNESINNCVRTIVNQANELAKRELNGRSAPEAEPKIESKVEPNCAASKMEESNKSAEPVQPKNDKTSTNKSDQHESITIIQTKPAPNSRPAIKFDANNNLAPQEATGPKADSTATTPQNESTDEIDKQTPVKNKQVNGDDMPAEKVKQEELPEIELIIRASNIDGKRKGADLFCQEYFMDLYLLNELNYIHLKISTVDLNKLTPSFRAKFDCTKPPILVVKSGNEQRAVLENEKIERYIMKNIPGGHLLFVKDVETAKLIENLYSKFKLALSRNEPQTKQSLLKHLGAIDKHLGERKSKFITGDHVCCFDFELITKLQHIRIAGEYFIDQFEIPKNLANLWKYMNTMYHLNAFVEAAPDDQTIIAHYLNSNSVLVNRTSPAKNKNQTLQKPNLTTSTP